MGRYRAPRLLENGDDVDRHRCRSEEQALWLRHHARQANAAGTSRVRVVTQPGSGEAVAYYAWCMASIRIEDAPYRLSKGAGRYPQPFALLTRLGVSVDHEGRGLAAGMVQDVVTRTAELGTEIGCRGLLVHAESPEARGFCLHLVLLMKDIVTILRG